ncbi:MAG TPA: hypothetical protein VK994_02880 [Bacteroidales bacterium]|nr:hypothetical protein [Bacteroidales bacterium]
MKKILLIMVFLASSIMVYPQLADTSLSSGREGLLSIYLDGGLFDLEYFKSYFTPVNYVIDRNEADVYLLLTALSTGSGGMEYSLLIKGNKAFNGISDTIVFYLPALSTTNQTRTEIMRNVQLGLVPFMMKTYAGKHLMLIIDDDAIGSERDSYPDHWKNWRIQLNGAASISSEKAYQRFGCSGGLYVTKITPQIKFESYNTFIFSESKYELYEGDTVIFSSFASQRSISSDNLFVKSLGKHFGIGGLAGYARSDFYNLRNHVVAGPAFEYSVFDYQDYTRKQLRFLYRMNFEYSDYIEETILGKTQDRRFTHDLGIYFLDVNQWGDINASLDAGSHLDDFSLFYVNTMLVTSIKMIKRMSLNISVGCSYVNNQIGLKKETIDPDDFLLQEFEVESDFSYRFSIGISIELGSKQNNVVNPRFTW